jgi:hypothetical protein
MDVRYDQIGAGLVPEAGSLLSVSGLQDFIPRVAEGDLKCLTNAGVIVHDEDSPLRPLCYLKVSALHPLHGSLQVEPDVVGRDRHVGVVTFDDPEPYVVIDSGVAAVLFWAEAGPAMRLVCRWLVRL